MTLIAVSILCIKSNQSVDFYYNCATIKCKYHICKKKHAVY